MIDKKIVEYFRKYKARGYSERQLKRSLLQQGYALRDIADSASYLEKLAKNPKLQKYSQNHLKQTSQAGNLKGNNNPRQKKPAKKQKKAPKNRNSSPATMRNNIPQKMDLRANPQAGMPNTNNSTGGQADKNRKTIIYSLLAILVLLIVAVILGTLYLDEDGEFFNFQENEPEKQQDPQAEQEEMENEQELNCGACQYESGGVCVDYACCSDQDCDDGDETTEDRCDNPGTTEAACLNEPLPAEDDEDSKIEEDENEEISSEDEIVNQTEDDMNTTTVTEEDAPDEEQSSQPQAPTTCDTDADCDDGDPATRDMCREQDNLCVREIIRECISGDDYCTPGCRPSEDEDCKKFGETTCLDREDCDDNNTATKDRCLKDFGNTYGICDFSPITNCIDNDDFCPGGCWHDDDNDCSTENECASEDDCEEHETATASCYGEPKRCIYALIEECEDDDGFCPWDCDNETDNDCINQTEDIEDEFWYQCGDDIFCYLDKLVETEDHENCGRIKNHWLDADDYFEGTCIFEIAKKAEDETLCQEITNAVILSRCENHFST